jgi:hypothetical protein
MSANERSFWQSHEVTGHRAKVTVEWSWPEGTEPPQEWLNRAEEIAEDAFAALGPKSYDISLALRGMERGKTRD